MFRESNHPAIFYQDMLGDRRRMQLYWQAIASVVREGDVVVDLGTGLGVLAIMAARAGAARVYAVDIRPQVLPLTRRILEANGVADRVTVMCSDALAADLPEPVDVIVNELIGDFGTDENIHECVASVARRYLKPGGRVLPRQLSTHMVGVSYDNEFRGVFAGDFHGMDLSPAVDDPFEPDAVMHGLRYKPTELTEIVTLEDIQFSADMPERSYRFPARLEIARAGQLQGFVGFFNCELAEGITLDNYPCYPGCHWVNWNWPVTPAIEVVPGQVVDGVLSAPEKTVANCWKWQWTLEDAAP